MDYCTLLKQRFTGTWDGDAPEIHGLVEAAGRKFKVELLFIDLKGQWQCAVFEGGECLSLTHGADVVEATARALAGAF